MITSIELENYRGFKQYRLDSLRRVNLLVGDNGSGKTSVLEALQILGSGGDPFVLGRTASQRGEVVIKGGRKEGGLLHIDPMVTHFFHGHQFELDAFFRVAADGDAGDLRFRVVQRTSAAQALLFVDDEVSDSALAIQAEGAGHPISATGFPITREGSFCFQVLRKSERYVPPGKYVPSAPQFVSPGHIAPRSMADMWNRVIIEEREPEVLEAMRVVDKRLRSIVFLGGDSDFRQRGQERVVVAMEGVSGRIPLGTLGGGLTRMLTLALSLIQSRGGLLLVDEIETGLHYSVMGEMWRLVSETARDRNTQVFAATHSLDCVRGLAWLCANYPELGQEVSIQKIHPGLEQAVAFDAEGIQITTAQEIEVR